MFFCWEARTDSTSTPGSLNSEISLETSANLETSTSKNGLALAICHSLKERFLLLCRNITDTASCILRKSSSTSFVQRNKREVTPLHWIHPGIYPEYRSSSPAPAVSCGRGSYWKTARPDADGHPARPWCARGRHCRRSAKL